MVCGSNSWIWLEQETKLNKNVNFAIRNFNIFRADRLTGAGGVTAIVVHDSIPIGNVKTFAEGVEAVSVDKFLNGNWMQIVSCYIPPDVTPSVGCSSRLAFFLNGNYCIIGGDFNAKDTSFRDVFSNCLGKWLIEFCCSVNFNIVNPANPTCFRCVLGSFIDIFLVRSVDIGMYCSTFESFSDHCGIRTDSVFFSSSTGQNLNNVKVFSWTNVAKLNMYILNELDKLQISLTSASQVWTTPSNISSHQIERLRLAERKLIRCTHNIFRPSIGQT